MTEHQDHPKRSTLEARLSAAWHDPDLLHAVVTEALDEDRAQAVVPAARRLRDIDPDPGRAVNLLALVLRTCADHAGAEQLLRQHLRSGADDALTWFNLAPMAAWRGDMAGAETALDQALRRDPNYRAALEWGFRHHHRTGGQQAATGWLRRHAQDSWRAHAMLGSELAAHGETTGALEYFDAAYKLAPHDPGPLTVASAALTEARRYGELVAFVLDRWRGSHGPVPLMDAIDANLELDRPGDAALGVTRLRGIAVPGELRERAADVEHRVQRACTDAGL